MAGWNGTGTYIRARDFTDDQAGGVKMLSANFDQEHDTVAAGIQNCLAKDGQNAMTGALNMGSQKLQALAAGTAATHGANLVQMQGGAYRYATSGGAANVQTLGLTPALTAYVEGQLFVFTAGFTNTAAATMNIDTIAAKNIFMHGVALVGYEIIAGEIYVIVYDGTQFNLIVPGGLVPWAARFAIDGDQTIATGGFGAAIDWDAAMTYEYGDLQHGTTTRIKCPIAGIYRTSGVIIFDANATGIRKIWAEAGSELVWSTRYDNNPHASSPSTIAFDWETEWAATNFQIWAYQDSGGNLNVDNDSYVTHRLVRRKG